MTMTKFKKAFLVSGLSVMTAFALSACGDDDKKPVAPAAVEDAAQDSAAGTSATDAAKEKAGEMVEQAKEKAGEMIDEAKEKAGDMATEAKGNAIDEAKKKAEEELKNKMPQ